MVDERSAPGKARDDARPDTSSARAAETADQRRDLEAGTPTEAANPRTRDLDRLETRAILEAIVAEDRAVPEAVARALPALTRAADALAAALAAGGRWLNAGAGTSGRLGFLDAAEIPPTFGLSPEIVSALVAGGPDALVRSVEGAEDDREAAREAIQARGLGACDALVALSASGHTPYTIAAAECARELGAKTIAITCAPDAPLARAVDIAIVAEVGPEVITGSTRMKGGLAQKMILHALSTTVMVKLGKTRGNRMTGLAPINAKLRARATRILCELSGADTASAERALAAAGGSIDRALLLLDGADRRTDASTSTSTE